MPSSFSRKDIYEKRTRLHNFNSYDDLVVNLHNCKRDIYDSGKSFYMNSRKKTSRIMKRIIINTQPIWYSKMRAVNASGRCI